MKKLCALLLLAALCPVFAGCSEVQQAENQAFVLVLGLDVDDAGNLELTVQIPEIKGKGGDSPQKENSEYAVVTTRGKGFYEALDLLSVTIPRRVNLTQARMIVVSEALAQRPEFKQILRDLAETYPLYASSYFTVCRDNVKEFIENQEPVFAPSVTSSLTALLEERGLHGYIPVTTFADVYYLTNSVYSDPLAILAANAEGAAANDPAEEMPVERLPGEIPGESELKNEYVGGAVLKDGRLAGKLDARQMVFTNLVGGNVRELRYSLNGQGLTLIPAGRPQVAVDLSEFPAQITFAQELLVDELAESPDREELQQALKSDITAVIGYCQSLGVEPFGFSEYAAAHFRTLDEWQRYDWHRQFSRARVDVQIRVRENRE